MKSKEDFSECRYEIVNGANHRQPCAYKSSTVITPAIANDEISSNFTRGIEDFSCGNFEDLYEYDRMCEEKSVEAAYPEDFLIKIVRFFRRSNLCDGMLSFIFLLDKYSDRGALNQYKEILTNGMCVVKSYDRFWRLRLLLATGKCTAVHLMAKIGKNPFKRNAADMVVFDFDESHDLARHARSIAKATIGFKSGTHSRRESKRFFTRFYSKLMIGWSFLEAAKMSKEKCDMSPDSFLGLGVPSDWRIAGYGVNRKEDVVC